MRGELLMFKSDSCGWCGLWEREIGKVWPLTPEAAVLRLQRIDLDRPGGGRPAGLASPVEVTPTFVVLQCGREIGRIVGYNDEAFFWQRLGVIIAGLPQHGRC